MTEYGKSVVPVWTLTTEDISIPNLFDEETLTPARLTELRTVLAALATAPIATLEMHVKPASHSSQGGVMLSAASPLAQHLAHLVTRTTQSAPVNAAGAGEVLYRMVVPAKVAAQVGQGLVKPMVSKAAAGGIHSALRSSTGIVSNASFVPVTGTAAAAGAASGSAVTAGVAVASAGALTVAAPLVLMAVSVGMTAYADHQKQKAIEKITELLEELKEDKLEEERASLEACSDTIDGATTVLLDEGELGLSLGLDSAVHDIITAFSRARKRLEKWEVDLGSIDGPIELEALTDAFPGIDKDRGTFQAHVEIAKMAIALKRRVLVLQAVDHAQRNPDSLFKSFVSKLNRSQQDIDELESRIATVLMSLSRLELKRPSGFHVSKLKPGEVDKLVKSIYRLRDLTAGTNSGSQDSDVAIEIEQHGDGSLTVFPAVVA
ncbi:hypothetical protein [Paenarthrobacter sp. NPDC091669]|uniref:hypothetical protein n=1 Tax=Paenarthrobacter sp. NPDC091669 TaxID=3364384 RepID=UPI0037F87A5A